MLNKALHTTWLRIVTLLFGAALAAFTVNFFIVPQGLYNGGLLGLCQVIRTVLDTQLGIRVTDVDLAGTLYLIANVPLLILAWRSMGRTFVFKLILCTVTQSLLMTVIPVPAQPIIDDMLTTCLIGGLLNGMALGLILTCGGSSGGMDILWLYLSKKRGVTIGKMGIMFNVCLYLLCLALFDVKTVIYSSIFSVVTSLFIDRMHQQNITVQALVMTKDKGEEIPQAILKALDRGVTYWEGSGAYTGDDVRVLCVCLSKYEIETLQNAVHAVDPHAFITVQEGVHAIGNFKRHLN
ncbi:MAG: YitT family protein [Oscillospiraceae bacterium]|nr:YitT family protein [Oscillospiraceae bacterium]